MRVTNGGRYGQRQRATQANKQILKYICAYYIQLASCEPVDSLSITINQAFVAQLGFAGGSQEKLANDRKLHRLVNKQQK